MSDFLLQIKGLQKKYSETVGETEVLRGIDLDVPRGRSVAIVGPSGCGKSTLLNILGLLDKPTAGTVLLDGQDFAGLSETAAAKVRNLRIGFVFQMHHLLPQCTVLENVLIPTLAGNTKASQKEMLYYAAELLDRVGLTGRMNYLPGQLSAGQRQRAALVRALINKPALLLADEPTGALDHAAAEQIARLMVELNQQEKLTLIVVTHSMDLAKKMDRRYELADGLLKTL
ncbi:MAG TPA: ABC transporter ATP-binding protein [Anaerohalosphaeraceae bacterium]|nr:ABC transporter ATP-binding protein [Anaerohalosphaeraceae bacterium]